MSLSIIALMVLAIPATGGAWYLLRKPPAVETEVSSNGLRSWTEASGERTTRAKFIEFDGQHVTLQKQDGKVVRVLAELLSEPDQQWLRTVGDVNTTPPSSQ